MSKKLAGQDEQFFQALFAYLKRKFNIKLDAFPDQQKNTAISIFNETIVALENVHEVLRKLDDGSAPTREDYEKAINAKDENRIKEILAFYKRLALLNWGESRAFQNFRRYYYFDPIISNYGLFLDQYKDPKSSEKDDPFSLARLWEQKNFDSNKVFTFIEAYQAFLSEKTITPPILDTVIHQDSMHESLLRDYDELVRRNVKFGTSVFDILLPSSLKTFENRDGLLSTAHLADIIVCLQDALKADDAILLAINHAHVISNSRFVLSFIVIYKAAIYKSSQSVCTLIRQELWSIVGSMHADKIQLKNRDNMLKSLYPNEVFTETLATKKDKVAFRDKFLRYFLYGIFLINFSKDDELEYHQFKKKLVLNNYIFYKEKIYINAAQNEKQVKVIVTKPSTKPPSINYMDELLVDSEVEKLDKYFSTAGLSLAEKEHLGLIYYLYHQQGFTTYYDDRFYDLLRIESFLSRLKHGNVQELKGIHTKTDFENSPKWSQLSLLFQQFLLVSEMNILQKKRSYPPQLSTSATSFIERYSDFFAKDYKINETFRLKGDLERYQTRHLRPATRKEQLSLDKACKKQQQICNYLATLLEKDMVVLRFIFRCEAYTEYKGELFDSMFREYIENLKHRHTCLFRLSGHVGVYIPEEEEHYIDATLLFEIRKINIGADLEGLQNAVAAYWENYVENKQQQIDTFNRKHHKQHSGDYDNPFSPFSSRRLTARPAPVVRTEHALNHPHVEIFQGQKGIQKLFMEKVSLFYAHCHLVLSASPKQLPRKNSLILGRISSPRTIKASPSKVAEDVSEAEELTDERPEASDTPTGQDN